MALGDSYANAAELAVLLGRADDGFYTDALAAASRTVEQFCRRQFNKTTTASARPFRPLDAYRLPVDDFHTTTDLAIVADGTTWDVADVMPLPAGGVHKGQTGWPFFELHAIDRTWPTWSRRPTITVTAQWGWPAVPPAVKTATLDLARVALLADVNANPVQSRAVDGFSESYDTTDEATVTTDPTVPAELAILIPYRIRKFGVA